MSIEEKIRAALLPLGVPDIENGQYAGKSQEYYVFEYQTIGVNYADDAPNHKKYLATVHYFCPLNHDPTDQRAATEQALFDAGFTWPETEDLTDETRRHIAFEFEDVGAI